MTSPLDRLVGKGLAKEPSDGDEFAGLVRAGLARLADAANSSVSLEGRFDLAYNAAHSLALAALRHRGYRATNRYLVFQALPHTLAAGPEVWRVLAKGHEIRNLAEYEGNLDIDERMVAEIVAAARKVADKVAALPPLRS